MQAAYGRAFQAQCLDDLATFKHGNAAMGRVQRDLIDSQAAGDAAMGALRAEFSLLKWGVIEADGSAAALELLARHVNAFSWRNIRRLDREFGA